MSRKQTRLDTNIVKGGRKRLREYGLDPHEFDSDSDSKQVPEVSKTETKPYPLVRQDAMVGDALIGALTRVRDGELTPFHPPKKQTKLCKRKLKNGKGKNKPCQKTATFYGMCSYHRNVWKKKNPWLSYPGQY